MTSVAAAPRRTTSTVAFAAVAALSAVLFAYWIWGENHTTDDTRIVLRGTAIAKDCLLRGTFVGCGQSAAELEAVGNLMPMDSAVGPYSPLQYIPAVFLQAAGLEEDDALDGLRWLNVLSFFALVYVLWHTTSRKGVASWGFLLALATAAGPLLFYANSTFAEMLGALVIAVFAASVLLRWPLVAVLCATWAAGLSKETAVPFLLVLGGVTLWSQRKRGLVTRPQVTGLLVGGGLAIACSGLLNVFRFGTPVNPDYLGDPSGTAWGDVGWVPWGQKVVHFVSLLVAPNGGMLFFWPAATLVIAAGGFFGLRALVRGAGRVEWIPPLTVIGVFLGLTVGFSNYFAPFGWHAWGPRYLVVWIPALMLFSVVFSAREFAALAGALTGSRVAAAVTVIAVTLSAIPHLGFLWRREALGRFFEWSTTCPWYPPRFTGHMYFDCTNHLAWRADSSLLDAARGVLTWPGAIYAAVFAAGAIGLVALARRELSRQASFEPTA